MKLTVSNTVMMKPLLHLDSHPQCLSKPHRMVGLLEITQEQHGQNFEPQKVVQYSQPGQQHVLPQTAKWQDFLTLDNAKNISCAAVFGFEFDGLNTWYQVWNQLTDQPGWLLHKNNMNYKAYAILTMDALVSLLPNWDGTLHPSLNKADKEDAGFPKPDTIDARQVSNLQVSDASTCAADQLWFLVTINSISNASDTRLNQTSTRKGWIAATIKI